MKKTLAIILTVMLVFTAFVTTVSAAQSPEQITGIVTDATGIDANGKSARIAIRPASGNYSDDFDKVAGNDEVVDYKELVLEGEDDPVFPIEVELVANGIKATDKGYILFKDKDGKIVKLTAVMLDGKIKVTFPSLGEFAVVLQKDTAKEPPKSPQTSDNLTPVLFALLIASAAVTLISVKKVRNAA